jgi:DNA-binding transcriptional LysR family regulator
LELRHLRYFVAAAETASVSKAALRVNVSQPALSRQIRDLEAELGVLLFDRVGRRIQLTADGADLLGRSRDVLAQAESLGERARALGGGTVGVLRVGATPQGMESVVAGFLARFRRSHPGVEIRLTEEGGFRLLSLVEQGELHLAFSGAWGGTRLRSRPMFPIRVLAVVAGDRRWARRSTIEIAELASERLLLLGRDFVSRRILDAACQTAQIGPRIVVESGQPHSLIALAEAGHGIAVVPSTVRIVSRKVRALPILQEGASLGAWGGVVWDPRRALPVYAVSFVEQLAAHVSRSAPGKRFDRIAPPVPRPGGSARVASTSPSSR